MVSEKVADILLKTNAVKINVKEPFTYTSGLVSPIYTDNRVLIGHTEERKVIVEGFSQLVKERGLQPEFLAGTATAGIPWASFMAVEMDLPMVYVRNKPKGHGAGKQIEGFMPEGKNILVVEDLISTGGSSLNSVNALRNEGKGVVHEVFAIFTYGFEKAENAFREASVAATTLTDIHVLMEVGKENGTFSDEDVEKVKAFVADPQNWASKYNL